MVQNENNVQTSVTLAVGHLQATEIKQLLSQWYESQSGLQNMYYLQQKEVSTIQLANARKINDMNRGQR